MLVLLIRSRVQLHRQCRCLFLLLRDRVQVRLPGDWTQILIPVLPSFVSLDQLLALQERAANVALCGHVGQLRHRKLRMHLLWRIVETWCQLRSLRCQ